MRSDGLIRTSKKKDGALVWTESPAGPDFKITFHPQITPRHIAQRESVSRASCGVTNANIASGIPVNVG